MPWAAGGFSRASCGDCVGLRGTEASVPLGCCDASDGVELACCMAPAPGAWAFFESSWSFETTAISWNHDERSDRISSFVILRDDVVVGLADVLVLLELDELGLVELDELGLLGLLVLDELGLL